MKKFPNVGKSIYNREMMNIVVDANHNALQEQNVIGMSPVQLAGWNSNIVTNGAFSALVDRSYEFWFRELLLDTIGMRDTFENLSIWRTNIMFEMFRNKPDILTTMELGSLDRSSSSSSSSSSVNEVESISPVQLSQYQVDECDDIKV